MTVTITGVEQINQILSVIAPNEAKNLLRATVYDIAKQTAQIAVTYTPDDPKTGKGDLKSSIKPKRGRGARDRVDAQVEVRNIRRNFFWRFLEYGDGPDNVEHAMFGRALETIRPDINSIYTKAFGNALVKRLARLRK